MIMYTTQAQAIQTITKLLTAHGYDPQDYDVLTIADLYHQEQGNYDDILGNPSIVWNYLNGINADALPASFAPRDWDKPEHNHVPPLDRFEVYDGPTIGGIKSNWQPGWGTLINLPWIGQTGDGLGVTIAEAKQLRDDLTAILEQLDQ